MDERKISRVRMLRKTSRMLRPKMAANEVSTELLYVVKYQRVVSVLCEAAIKCDTFVDIVFSV